ncbi:hypothetical protein V3C99_003603 [Haemonchus contortus]
MSCSCPDAYCGGVDERRLRINAELFELSPDGTKWLMVDGRMMYISVYRNEADRVRIAAVSQTGRTMLDTVLGKDQKVEKISDCFVYWRDADGRTLGVNTLSAKDATLFLTHTAPTTTPITTMVQHNVIAQVTVIGSWDGERVQQQVRKQETTMASINPLSMVFHFNHGLINIDLLECFITTTAKPNVLHLSYASHIYEFEFVGEASRFANQVLNMSSLLLARTTCNDVAVSFLNRQHQKVMEKLSQVNSEGDVDPVAREKALLKDFAIQYRLAALNNKPLPTFQDLSDEVKSRINDRILVDSPLTSVFLVYNNLYEFRMWRKSVDVRVSDLRALCSSTAPRDIIMNCPSSSSDSIFRIELPNGNTTVISHGNQNPRELLEKVCLKLAVQPELFELTRGDDGGWKLSVREEYEVHKRHAKLGLTIYAYNDNGVIRAEVRGLTSYAPEGADIGDMVVSVDGKLVSKVGSAADVERMLTEGRVIRLRKNRLPAKSGSEAAKTPAAEKFRPLKTNPPPGEIPTPNVARTKNEERLLRSLEELLQTEKKYVDDLKEMIDRYLSIPSVREIMESALRLQKMQVSFLDSLEEALGDIGSRDLSARPLVRDAIIRLCALFVNRCGDFKVYAEYAAAYLRLLQELPSRKDMLASLEAANSSKEQHCSYESRMIKPVQRVVQYPLLLRAIQSCCDQDSLQAKQVEVALQKMQTLAEYVNEMQRVHEQYAPHIDALRRQNDVLFREKGLRIDIRDLVLFAHVQWLNAEKSIQEYVIFVFHTLILLLPRNARRDCKMKLARMLPINEVQVEDNRKDDPILTIVHTRTVADRHYDVPYHIACCQLSLKQQLIRSIKKARTNFSRETRRPLSGSSQSDGGYGSDPMKDRKSS